MTRVDAAAAARIGVARAGGSSEAEAKAADMLTTLPDAGAPVSCAPTDEAQDPAAELVTAAREHLAALALVDSYHHALPAGEVLRALHPSRQRLSLAANAVAGA